MSWSLTHHRSTPILVLLLAGLLTFTACQSSPSATNEEVEVPTVTTTKGSYLSMPAIPASIQNSTSGSEMMELMAPSFNDTESFYKTWRDTPSIEERNEYARSMLDAHNQPEDFFLRSIVAEKALIAILQTDTPEKYTSSVDLYTTVLLANDSFNTVVIGDALNVLQGTWSAEKIDRSAQATVDNAIEWLERTNSISEKIARNAETSERAHMSATAHERTRAAVQSGIRTLSAMVGSS